ncbi:MAG: HAMP domain-containing sensor histidine kinase, partial [Desulforhabdus sp.]|nr:HAMP domain-containing sensor histidine kinase [Desulforhabdus sp.]
MVDVKYSIKTKIFFIILIPGLILLFAVYLDYMHLSSLGRSADRILSKNYRSIKSAHKIGRHLSANQNAIIGVLFFDREPDSDESNGEDSILRLIQTCEDNITEAGEEKIIKRLFDKNAQYEYLFRFLSDRSGAETNRSVRGVYYEFAALTASMSQDLNHLIGINEGAMEAADEATQEIARRALRYSIGLLVSAILFTLIFSFIFSSRISRPLTDLARDIADIKEGSGEYPQFPITTRDEIGFLTAEFNRLLDRLKLYDQLSADKLMAEKLKVRRTEEAKAQFIADLSHQLKTPMTSLGMSVGIISDKLSGRLEGKYGKLLQTAREDCSRLSTLTNELVDIARLDAMLKPRAKESLGIRTIVTECVKPLLCQADEKGVEIVTEIEPDVPSIAIDSLRFPWVITNLLGNAIRYTEKGGRVTLRATR